MRTINVQVPFSKEVYLTLVSAGLSEKKLDEKLRVGLAMELYQEGNLSLGKAAEVAGKCLATFLDILSEHQIPVVSYSKKEVDDIFRKADKLAKELKK